MNISVLASVAMTLVLMSPIYDIWCYCHQFMQQLLARSSSFGVQHTKMGAVEPQPFSWNTMTTHNKAHPPKSWIGALISEHTPMSCESLITDLAINTPIGVSLHRSESCNIRPVKGSK
jgi:hypothetical protein